MNKGTFIAIEGPDASGKGTQQKLLVDRLKLQGLPVVTVDFPQYETSLFGKLVGQMLHEEFGPLSNIDPHIASVIYAADRLKASGYIASHIAEGEIVVANRYTLSNMAHQSARLPEAKRVEFIRWLYRMEYGEEGFTIPKPDLYVHLDVPIEITQELVLQKAERAYLNGEKKDALEADVAHQIEAAKMYHQLAEVLPEVTSIQCASEGSLLPPEIIHELVWEVTKSSLREDREGIISRERES